jgi:acyl carrier protein
MANGFTGWIQYSTDLFDADRIERMAAHFQTLLGRIVSNPTERLSRLLPLTSAEEQVLQRDRIRFDPSRSVAVDHVNFDQSFRSITPKHESLPALNSPKDVLELKLVAIWQKVLGLPSVRTNDNFFDLGGHSLAALRLFAEVRKLTGRHLPLATLFQAPTVLQLASILRDSGWTPPWRSLVPIQPAGTKSRFYCVHGGGGNVLLFRNLARALGEDYPFYGLQARGLNGAGKYLTTVEEMAAEYLNEIREFQPEGPYCLGGFCMGGQVAFQMAKLLTAAKQKVSLLVLFDTYNHNGVPQTLSLVQRASYLNQKARFHWQSISALSSKDRRVYLREKIREVGTREWDRFSSCMRRVRVPFLKRFQQHSGSTVFLEKINDYAGFSYRPTPYSGKLTIIKPRRNYSFVKDNEMGWGGLASGGVRTLELPIYPGAMFNEPFVQLLAQQLRICLDAAEEVHVNSIPTNV